ncbi:hybrid sensor histidine kinase/response regulator [Chitinophaga qingshengii]|uniref:histidine kinase n=1 Tax=Chitinophaga qingshengii TaxID=1569794 RepID=A0ABR7TF81_9BACT|nr:two-component regulator propeller domain-containing protein [Chitinophaga qingshengii]MBC9928982.1 response regulator [Chitinophaga qingshengii]
MKRLSLICSLLIGMFTCAPVVFAGDTASYYIQQLDNRNGLSNSAVNALLLDSDKLLWAATWDGLNMYDGSSFHVFNYSKDNPQHSIGNNVVLQATEDGQRRIWMSTIEGVSRYDKQSGKFYNYFYSRQQRSRISEQEYRLLTDTTGQLYCLSRQEGLARYNAAADSFVACPLPGGNNRISKAVFDGANHLWVLRGDGTLEIYADWQAQWPLLQRYRDVQALFAVNGRIFFTTTARELMAVSPGTHQAQLQVILPHPVNAMTVYHQHYLLAWTTQGFGEYDAQFRPAHLFSEAARELQDMKIISWATGNEEVLWCGTDGNGIIKIYPQIKYFGTVNRNSGAAFNKPIRAFCANGDDLWVGTKGNGIICLPNFSRQAVGTHQRLFSAELDNNSVFALCQGMDSMIFIGTDGKGLAIYDQLHKRFIHWQEVNGSGKWPVFGSVYAILPDADSSLWLGTSGYGLIQLRIRREGTAVAVTAFRQYTFNGSDSGPANDIIYSLAPGPQHSLWVGCRYGGLNLFDKRRQTFQVFKAFSYDGGLSHNDVLALYRDTQQRLWIGTSYGLNCIAEADVSQARPAFVRYNTGNGLPNNTIHAITQDNNGMIWVSTNKGLARINPATAGISHFQEADGLQSNEFSDGAVWKDPGGRLYFGGIYGFNYFTPRITQERRVYPNLLVSGLQLAGKASGNGLQVLQPAQSNTAAYTLNRRDNFFELQGKVVSFLHAEKCEYAWLLEGYDKSWQYTGGNGRVAYSNVPPGTYVLKVKWSNGEGGWTPPGVLLTLTVQQYFWLTWPAFLLYLLVLGGAGTAFWLYRKNKLQMKHQLEMEHLLRKKEEEVHEEQLRFFTNIAHELQTPLTLIVGAAERSREQPGNTYHQALVHQHASRLTYLVQQLLEFRRAEAGFLKNSYSPLNISALLENIAALFKPMCQQKALRFETHIAPDMIAPMDKDKLEKILFNLLSNACKYTSRDETILLRAEETIHGLDIYIYNSGSHIPAEQLDNLFTRFFSTATATHGAFGTGIGLAFTQQLVQLLDGSIRAVNENNGVAFYVRLPLSVTDTTSPQQQEAPADPVPSGLMQSMTADLSLQAAPLIDPNKLSRIQEVQETGKKSVLLVEDEYAIRQLLKDLLAGQYIIYEAGNGHEALELMRQTLPDLIISDIMMPDMNGLELCNKVKNAASTCHIPFIILSARGTIDQQTEGYEAGADAYLPKPFHATHLQVRVRKLLEYRQRLHDIFKRDQPLGQLEEAGMPDTDKQFLQELVRVIEERIDEEGLNAEALEKHLLLSKMQLYRKLKTLTNMTPAEFIRYIRLKQAAQLLIKTQLTVSEIFYKTGFNNQSYFFREFKKMYHCSPNEYREQQTAV